MLFVAFGPESFPVEAAETVLSRTMALAGQLSSKSALRALEHTGQLRVSPSQVGKQLRLTVDAVGPAKSAARRHFNSAVAGTAIFEASAWFWVSRLPLFLILYLQHAHVFGPHLITWTLAGWPTCFVKNIIL